jgi:hypothetical protein
LAAANAPGTWPGSDQAATAADTSGTDQVADRAPKGPGREKRNASSQAKGARRQAKRDSKGR